MRYVPLLWLLFFSSIHSYSQNPYAYDWSTDLKGDNSENRVRVLDLVTDSQGYIYSVGDYRGEIDFSNGLGIATLVSTDQDDRDCFIKKTDPDGNLVWVKQIGGSQDDWITAIDIDSDDNIYVTGFFEGGIDLDPSVNDFFLGSSIHWDIFAAKYTSNGELIWGKSFEGGGVNMALDLCINTDFNLLLVSGGVRNNINFNSDDPSDIIQIDGERDAFVLSLDLAGNYNWSKVFGGPGEDLARSLKIMSDSTIVVGGSVGPGVFYDGTALGNGDTESAFLVTLDLLGGLTSSIEFSGSSKSRVVDISNVNEELWVVGEFVSDLMIMGEEFQSSSPDSEENNVFFMNKTSGNWSSNVIASEGSVYANTITNLGDGSATIAGYFKDAVDFNWNPNEEAILESGNQEMNYMLRVLDTGAFSWVSALESIGNSEMTAIEYYEEDAFLVAGIYEGTIDLGLNIPSSVVQQTNNISSGFELMLKRDNLELICKDTLEVTLNDSGQFLLSPDLLDEGSYSFNGGELILSLDNDIVDCSLIENESIVTLFGLDVISGDSEYCETFIMVNELVAPTAICQDIVVYIDDNDFVEVDAYEVGALSFDNCLIDTMVLANNTFTCQDMGFNDLELTVTDISGLSSTCTSSILIADNIGPELVCSPITISLDSEGNIDLEELAALEIASDNCQLVEYGILFDLDPCDEAVLSVPSELYAIDNAGNENSCEIDVMVIDEENPTLECSDLTIVMDESTLELDVLSLDGLFVAEDNCGISWTNSSVETISYADVGELSVDIYVLDFYGNRAECTVNLNIILQVNEDDLFFAPNIFTPNFDGANDKFNLSLSNQVASIKYFEVLDRWGNSMFKRKDITASAIYEGWDGSFNGSLASEGVYFYRLQLDTYDNNVHDYNGTVYLSK
jgi:gliding motility-associated-like protein